ncbi:hypothetical protein J1N10_08940 [Carboxylicivirga sp. A043]|uniref:hypothetical protein n=1 Tax=Carboxylicivirga litoralis TaxID=2816963 RepID=UPI0021CB3B57|nr:hypothetical protein [Carboxylicivirga sp. A043]MCU4156103.1 hypothetical protein [Carboxylicivirga sp. A043]
MRLRLVILLLLGLNIHTIGQETSEFGGLNADMLKSDLSSISDTLPIADFSMNVGVSAFSDFGNMYGFNTYLAPQWSLMPLKKFQVDVLPYVSRTNYYNVPVWGVVDATKLTLDESMLQFGVYAQGTYLINDKWYAGAAVFLDTTMPENENSQFKGLSNYGASTYVGYKFSDNFSAEVSFGVSKYPTFYNPSPGFTPLMHPRNPYNRF